MDIEIDRPLVKEGDMVKAGQAIGVAGEKRISFYVSNYLNRISVTRALMWIVPAS